MSLTINSATLEYVQVPVSAIKNGARYDPTAKTVQFAFKDAATFEATDEPEAADWTNGTWDTDGTRHKAQILVGPGGTFEPTDSTTYWVWVKVLDTTENPVRNVGKLVVK